jgi:hypothetical protein
MAMAFTTRTAMTTKRSIKWGLVAVATAWVAVAAMPGCELLVDFDRSKIPVEGGDFDGTTAEGDTSIESSIPEDAGSGDGAAEGSADAPADAPFEADVEAGSEAAAPDAGSDAPVETGMDDGATDSGDGGG